MYTPIESEIFHVHTHRCGHASDDTDESYVLKAIEYNKKRLVFTDHAPFPGDPFGSRMKMDEYPEYIESIHSLKEKYKDKIEVLCGLEIEYFPQYMNYYKELKESEKIDLLILGQHMYMHDDGKYNFMDKDRSDEFRGISKAMIDGMNTGFFDVLAHPDRMLMRYPQFDDDALQASYDVIQAAKNNNVLLEKNYSSIYKENNYCEKFWTKTGMIASIVGYDAHSIADIEMIASKLE